MQTVTSEEYRHMLAGDSIGICWSATTETMNVNLAVWDTGHTVGEHVNSAVDVALIVLSGEGRLTIDDAIIDLAAGVIASIPRGARRSVVADSRLAYVTVHRARGGLMPAMPAVRQT